LSGSHYQATGYAGGHDYLPKFFGVKNNDDGTMEEFYRKTGEFWFWNANRFLEKIIKLSKLA